MEQTLTIQKKEDLLQKPWYSLTEEERKKSHYVNHTLQEFWDWWSDGNESVMEVRFKESPYAKQLIREIAKRLDVPYAASGVFVTSVDEVRKVIAFAVKHKQGVWLGLNPKKKSYTPYAKYGYNGLDVSIKEVKFFFIDIDRIDKGSPADESALRNADVLSNVLVDRMAMMSWSNSYAKVCSGNGVQLIFKLDKPLIMPDLEYKTVKRKGKFGEEDGLQYIATPEYNRFKDALRSTIGIELSKYAAQFTDSLDVEIDVSGFNIGRVAALPFSRNYKYIELGVEQIRGLLEIKNGVNEGLTDYILQQAPEDTYKYVKRTLKRDATGNYDFDTVDVENLRRHPLIDYMFTHAGTDKFPAGGRNNILWLSVKILLWLNKIDFMHPNVVAFQQDMEFRCKDKFPLNNFDLENGNYSFSADYVNQYFFNVGLPPLFKFSYKKNITVDKSDYIPVEILKNTKESLDLDSISGSFYLPKGIKPYVVLRDVRETYLKCREDSEKINVDDDGREGSDDSALSLISSLTSKKSPVHERLYKALVERFGRNKANYIVDYYLDRALNYVINPKYKDNPES